jgi:parallel beta-helix repeat protein
VLRQALVAIVASAVVGAAADAARAAVIRVPQDEPTIQAGIDAAGAGDTVLVFPGTYVENVDFRGKDITVRSKRGSKRTKIDGNRAGAVVRIVADAGETPTLRGFTIRNGSDGGVRVSGGSPLIQDNVIRNNAYCGEGGGIALSFSSATVRRNVIKGNFQSGCSGGSGGGGLIVGGNSEALIVDNVISGNSHGSHGGGITLFAAGSPTISGNVITGNEAANQGGGIWIVNRSDAVIENNVIADNTATEGGGVYWLVPSGGFGPFLFNNTIADNHATRGIAVFADGFDELAHLLNNILVGSGTGAVVHCGNFNDPNEPIIGFNDVLNTGPGAEYGGICSDHTGVDGNISADPRFVGGGNYHLRPGSPAIDAASFDGMPPDDIDGDPRPLDGNGDGDPLPDMGADELVA